MMHFFWGLMKKFLNDMDREKRVRNLKPLSRNVNLDNSEYEDYLNQAMSPDQDEIIRNIAIAGKYGSGKSSVIDSYFSKYFKKDYLRVSFATFKGQTQGGDEGSSGFDANEIYLNIINQVIYQVKPSKIPLTGFKVKKPLSKKRKAALILTGLLLLSWRFNWPNVDHLWLEYSRNLIAIGFLIWATWYALSSISISNLVMKIKGISADVRLGNDDFFEKYGDEIIYLFRQSGKRILIIEDLDRFQDIRVFEKLRELNTKLNANGHSNWQFIYLIKDDIFLDPNDRVKFFDLMIPIVPFMTAANSYEKTREMFMDETVDDELLFTLSLFVTDYRLLTNIFNEYTVFKSSTKTSELNELLSMVSYKNLYPDEFDGVQNGRGKLADIFNGYQTLAESKKAQLVAEKQELIQTRESTVATNEAEAFFLYVSRKRLHTDSNIATPEAAKTFIANNSKVYYQNQWLQYSDFLETDDEYKKIYTALEKFDEQIQLLNKEIKRIEDSDITSYAPDNLQTEHDKMVYTLIRQGYIRQNYLDVINRFYGEENSRQFLQNALVGQGEPNMDLKFDSIDTWWKKIKPSVFETVQIQNFSVLEYAKKNDTEKYKIMIRSAALFNTEFLEGMLRNEDVSEMSIQYFDDFMRYAPEYLFSVKDLDKTIISKIIQNRRYATDPENIELLIEYMVDNSKEEFDKSFVNDSNQDTNLRVGVLERAISQIDFADLTDEDFWDRAISFGVVNATIDNLNTYFEEKGLSEVLQNFIVNNHFDSNGSKLNWDLFSEMLVAGEISSEILSRFVSELDRDDKFIWENIKSGSNVDKLILLIQHNMVSLRPDVFETIRDSDELLPAELITQNVVDFLTKQNIKPLSGWINQFIGVGTLNIKKFLETFMQLLDEQQYRRTIHLLSNQSEKFEKILNQSRGYANQKIVVTADNELLLTWLVDHSYIKSFSLDGGRNNYALR